MAMIKCRECGNEISSEAANCPHCGCPSITVVQKKRSNSTLLWTLFIMGATLLGVIATCASLGLL